MAGNRRLARLAVTAAALMMAAGCGASSGSGSPATPATPSASALTRQMRAAMGAATSVHISGTAAQGGKSTSLDLSITRAGGLSGSIAVGSVPVTILVTDGKAYVKTTAASMKAMHIPASDCSLLCGKYLELAGADAKGMTGDLSWSSLVSSGLLSARTLNGLKVIRSVTLGGQSAWLLRSPDGSTGYVAAHGPAYLLRIIPARSQGVGHMDLSEWNSATIPPPPPASQVVTASQLGG